MDIGSLIKAVRKTKNLSQKQISLSIDMDPSQFSKIESGKTDPSVYTIERIAKAMGISLAELFKTEDQDDLNQMSSVDKTIMEKVQIIEQLDETEKNALFDIIDGLFAKKKLRNSISSALDNNG